MNLFKEATALLQRIGDEVEHVCTATRAGVDYLDKMLDQLEKLRLRLERIDGRLERLELALQRGQYPNSQQDLAPDELAQARARGIPPA